MYAPLIQGNITITVTGEVASAVIAWAELGHEHDDCWSLRDGTTTTDPQKALTDAVVVVAEDTDSRPWPFRLVDDSESTEQDSTPTNTGTLDLTVDSPRDVRKTAQSRRGAHTPHQRTGIKAPCYAQARSDHPRIQCRSHYLSDRSTSRDQHGRGAEDHRRVQRARRCFCR
jgi:hypothetical protein